MRPTMNFTTRSCKRGVSKCYVEAVKVVNEFLDDHNSWRIMQTFFGFPFSDHSERKIGAVSPCLN